MPMAFYESLIFGIRKNEVKAKGVQNNDQMKVKNAVGLSLMLSCGQQFQRFRYKYCSNSLLNAALHFTHGHLR